MDTRFFRHSVHSAIFSAINLFLKALDPTAAPRCRAPSVVMYTPVRPKISSALARCCSYKDYKDYKDYKKVTVYTEKQSLKYLALSQKLPRE